MPYASYSFCSQPPPRPSTVAPVRDLVERRHRVREHRGVPVAGGVHERSARHAFGRGRERGVRGDRFETVRVAAGVGRVEVVPDRDPVEAELLDAAPQLLQLGDRRVLQPGVHSEPDRHDLGSRRSAGLPRRSARGGRDRRACGTAGTRSPRPRPRTRGCARRLRRECHPPRPRAPGRDPGRSRSRARRNSASSRRSTRRSRR